MFIITYLTKLGLRTSETIGFLKMQNRNDHIVAAELCLITCHVLVSLLESQKLV